MLFRGIYVVGFSYPVVPNGNSYHNRSALRSIRALMLVLVVSVNRRGAYSRADLRFTHARPGGCGSRLLHRSRQKNGRNQITNSEARLIKAMSGH